MSPHWKVLSVIQFFSGSSGRTPAWESGSMLIKPLALAIDCRILWSATSWGPDQSSTCRVSESASDKHARQPKMLDSCVRRLDPATRSSLATLLGHYFCTHAFVLLFNIVERITRDTTALFGSELAHNDTCLPLCA
jgi:hypothetical protein